MAAKVVVMVEAVEAAVLVLNIQDMALLVQEVL